MQEVKVNDIVEFMLENELWDGSVEEIRDDTVYVYAFFDEEIYEFNKSDLRVLEKIVLDEETYRKLARYEVTVLDVAPNGKYEYIDNRDNYLMTIEDILCAVKNAIARKVGKREFYREWYCFFQWIVGRLVYENPDNCFYSRNELLNVVYGELYEWIENDEGELQDVEKIMENFLEDEQKPLLSRRYPRYAKQKLVLRLKNEDVLNSATDEEVMLFRQFAEELADMDDCDALSAVGYGCYGGNRAFNCDWARAEKCMLRLMDLCDIPGSAYYANTLGYIYYYGRVSGTPDYERAFKYFSFGALNGVIESQYKLADMLVSGKGGIKSYETASDIIRRLYHENLKYIQAGIYNTKFADIALRMGNIIKNDKTFYDGEWIDVLYYYMQAQFAIRQRISEAETYGDIKVADSIEQEINECKQVLQITESESTDLNSLCSVFCDFFECGGKMDVTVDLLEDGKRIIEYKARRQYKSDKPSRMFLTIPRLNVCGLFDSLTVIATELEDDIARELPAVGKYKVDDDMFEAYRSDYFATNIFRNCNFTVLKPTVDNTVYRFVAVKFAKYGKAYDYLCDDENVKIGDKITVAVKGEEKVVTVVNVFQRTASACALPISAYKSIKSDSPAQNLSNSPNILQ